MTENSNYIRKHFEDEFNQRLLEMGLDMKGLAVNMDIRDIGICLLEDFFQK